MTARVWHRMPGRRRIGDEYRQVDANGAAEDTGEELSLTVTVLDTTGPIKNTGRFAQLPQIRLPWPALTVRRSKELTPRLA